jgi:hypothetical protein
LHQDARDDILTEKEFDEGVKRNEAFLKMQRVLHEYLILHADIKRM